MTTTPTATLPDPRTAVLAAIAMIAFAANSLLCRMALLPGPDGTTAIDAAGFTAVRTVAGAITLALIVALRGGAGPSALRLRPDWRMVAGLSVYMVFFSFAYLSLGAGAGALILFGAVQVTMFAAALSSGERFGPVALAGLALAMGGLVYLVSPGVSAPDPLGAALMAVAGVAWGVYSLRGRGAFDPLGATARNFLWTVPPVLLLAGIFRESLAATPPGLALAVASGALASGCGYVIWYAALRGLTAGRAATLQLSVPVIAALGGAAFLGEEVTLRLVLASAATLGGVVIVLTRRRT